MLHAALLFCILPCRADLAAPDNILYGLVVLNSNLVTAAETDVVIEARRTTDGVPIARYRMGTRPEAGNFYMLAISLEELAPVHSPVAVLTNTNLRIVVLRAGVEKAEVPFQLTERGQMLRVDFGILSLTGYDAWAANQGLPSGTGPLDKDGDGFSNMQEYVAGTDPNNPNDHFSLVIAQAMNGVELSFAARCAEGTGYANQTRHYTLLSAPDPQTNVWTNLVSYSKILGGSQRFIYTLPATNPSPAFYRGRVELRGP